jgi:hypothetical protein
MMLEKRAETSVPIHELLARRWSPRAYDANRPDEIEAREIAPRKRRPLAGCFFEGAWETPVKAE